MARRLCQSAGYIKHYQQYQGRKGAPTKVRERVVGPEHVVKNGTGAWTIPAAARVRGSSSIIGLALARDRGAHTGWRYLLAVQATAWPATYQLSEAVVSSWPMTRQVGAIIIPMHSTRPVKEGTL